MIRLATRFDNPATLLSRVKNRVSRKARELTPGEFSRLFHYLRALQRHEPGLLPALVPLERPLGQLVLLEFREPELVTYNGLELIVFDDRRYLYYRLPGALPNGAGHVAPGIYRVRFHAIDDVREVFLVLKKEPDRGLTLVEQSLAPSSPSTYVRLDAHELDYSWIVPELRGLVLRWLTTHPVDAKHEGLAELLAYHPKEYAPISLESRALLDALEGTLPRK